mmetsp:Transcript_12825/g.31976  ORF Transcript_12825/g.31976 Transcript_12825/m.31976 type:complete len:326 (-) Transcript_12825:209-1186(-)
MTILGSSPICVPPASGPVAFNDDPLASTDASPEVEPPSSTLRSSGRGNLNAPGLVSVSMSVAELLRRPPTLLCADRSLIEGDGRPRSRRASRAADLGVMAVRLFRFGILSSSTASVVSCMASGEVLSIMSSTAANSSLGEGSSSEARRGPGEDATDRLSDSRGRGLTPAPGRLGTVTTRGCATGEAPADRNSRSAGRPSFAGGPGRTGMSSMVRGGPRLRKERVVEVRVLSGVTGTFTTTGVSGSLAVSHTGLEPRKGALACGPGLATSRTRPTSWGWARSRGDAGPSPAASTKAMRSESRVPSGRTATALVCMAAEGPGLSCSD